MSLWSWINPVLAWMERTKQPKPTRTYRRVECPTCHHIVAVSALSPKRHTCVVHVQPIGAEREQ